MELTLTQERELNFVSSFLNYVTCDLEITVDGMLNRCDGGAEVVVGRVITGGLWGAEVTGGGAVVTRERLVETTTRGGAVGVIFNCVEAAVKVCFAAL